VVASFHMCRQTKPAEQPELREIPAKRLQPVLFLGIGVAPPLETDLNRLAVCRHVEIHRL